MLLVSGLEVRRQGLVTLMLSEQWSPGAVSDVVTLSTAPCCELSFM